MRSVIILTIAASLLGLAGCGQPAKRIDSTQRIVSIHDIDVQDWEDAASDLLNSLLTRGPLGRYDRDRPAVLAVSRIVNDTAQRINIAHLTDYVLTELNRSQRAQASLIEGIGGPDDPMLAEAMRGDDFLAGRDAPVYRYTYTLSGRIIEERRGAGRTRQSTFVFVLRLGDPRTGTAVWQERYVIDKQGTRPAVGM